jgi:uncharacterized repeat protein (TIGR02543 family)
VKGLGVKMKKHKGNFKVQFGARIASIFAVVAIFGFTVQAAASNTTYSTSSGTTYTIDGTLQKWEFGAGESTFVAPESGLYNFKIYGAQGSNYSTEFTDGENIYTDIISYKGGKGSYINATLSLEKDDIIYLKVGKQGYDNLTTLGGGSVAAPNGGQSTQVKINSTDDSALALMAAGGGAASEYKDGLGGDGLTSVITKNTYNDNGDIIKQETTISDSPTTISNHNKHQQFTNTYTGGDGYYLGIESSETDRSLQATGGSNYINYKYISNPEIKSEHSVQEGDGEVIITKAPIVTVNCTLDIEDNTNEEIESDMMYYDYATYSIENDNFYFELSEAYESMNQVCKKLGYTLNALSQQKEYPYNSKYYGIDKLIINTDINLYTVIDKSYVTINLQDNKNFYTHTDGTYYTFDKDKKTEFTSSEIPTPTHAGYTFGGWYTTESYTGDPIVSGSICDFDNDTTLYAKWTPNTYTVTFNANGGSLSGVSSKQVTYDSTYGSLPTATKSGYTFGGWFTSTTGGDNISDDTIVEITTATTLYAHWISSQNTVVAYTNGSQTKYTVQETGYYRIDAWGAQGGSSGNSGGLGGHVSAVYYLEKGTELYLDPGSTNGHSGGGESSDTTKYDQYQRQYGNGGGASAVYIGAKSGKNNVLVMAGGGGGGNQEYSGGAGGYTLSNKSSTGTYLYGDSGRTGGGGGYIGGEDGYVYLHRCHADSPQISITANTYYYEASNIGGCYTVASTAHTHNALYKCKGEWYTYTTKRRCGYGTHPAVAPNGDHYRICGHCGSTSGSDNPCRAWVTHKEKRWRWLCGSPTNTFTRTCGKTDGISLEGSKKATGGTNYIYNYYSSDKVKGYPNYSDAKDSNPYYTLSEAGIKSGNGVIEIAALYEVELNTNQPTYNSTTKNADVTSTNTPALVTKASSYQSNSISKDAIGNTRLTNGNITNRLDNSSTTSYRILLEKDKELGYIEGLGELPQALLKGWTFVNWYTKPNYLTPDGGTSKVHSGTVVKMTSDGKSTTDSNGKKIIANTNDLASVLATEGSSLKMLGNKLYAHYDEDEYYIQYVSSDTDNNVYGDSIHYSDISSRTFLHGNDVSGYSSTLDRKTTGSTTTYYNDYDLTDTGLRDSTSKINKLLRAYNLVQNQSTNKIYTTYYTQKCLYDHEVTLLPNLFTKTGYYFNGWATKIDTSNTTISNTSSDKDKHESTLTSTRGSGTGKITGTKYYECETLEPIADGENFKRTGTQSTGGGTGYCNFTYITNAKKHANQTYSVSETNYAAGSYAKYSYKQSTNNSEYGSNTVLMYAVWEPITYSLQFNGTNNWNKSQGAYLQTVDGVTKIRYDQHFTLADNKFLRDASETNPHYIYVDADENEYESIPSGIPVTSVKITQGYTLSGWGFGINTKTYLNNSGSEVKVNENIMTTEGGSGGVTKYTTPKSYSTKRIDTYATDVKVVTNSNAEAETNRTTKVWKLSKLNTNPDYDQGLKQRDYKNKQSDVFNVLSDDSITAINQYLIDWQNTREITVKSYPIHNTNSYTTSIYTEDNKLANKIELAEMDITQNLHAIWRRDGNGGNDPDPDDPVPDEPVPDDPDDPTYGIKLTLNLNGGYLVASQNEIFYDKNGNRLDGKELKYSQLPTDQDTTGKNEVISSEETNKNSTSNSNIIVVDKETGSNDVVITLNQECFNRYLYSFDISGNVTTDDLLKQAQLDVYGYYSNGTDKDSYTKNYNADTGLNIKFYKYDDSGNQYRLLGWSTSKGSIEPDVKVEIDGISGNNFDVYDAKHNTKLKIANDTTLYAVWEPVLKLSVLMQRVLGNSTCTIENAQAYNWSTLGTGSISLKPGEEGKYIIIANGETIGTNSITASQVYKGKGAISSDGLDISGITAVTKSSDEKTGILHKMLNIYVKFDDVLTGIYDKSSPSSIKDNLNMVETDDDVAETGLAKGSSPSLNRTWLNHADTTTTTVDKETNTSKSNNITKSFRLPLYAGTTQSSNAGYSTYKPEGYDVVFTVTKPSWFWKEVKSQEDEFKNDPEYSEYAADGLEVVKAKFKITNGDEKDGPDDGDDGPTPPPGDNEASLVIDPNGGTWNGSESVSTINKDITSGTVTESIPIPTRQDYVFTGWTISSSFKGELKYKKSDADSEEQLDLSATYTYPSESKNVDRLKANWYYIGSGGNGPIKYDDNDSIASELKTTLQ